MFLDIILMGMEVETCMQIVNSSTYFPQVFIHMTMNRWEINRWRIPKGQSRKDTPEKLAT